MRSLSLRGPAGAKAAVNNNCVGMFLYAGGWSDASMGGVLEAGGGCHRGGASAVVSCAGRVPSMQDDLDEVCGAPLAPPPAGSPPPGKFFVLDPSKYAGRIGGPPAVSAWAAANVPFIDLPDTAPWADVANAFYYRWRVLFKHVKYTADGFVMTEFLPYVPWSGRHNAIPAAAGHHIMEARWLHDRRVVDDVTRFWTDGRGDPSTYTNWIGYAALQRFYVDGNATALTSMLDGLVTLFTGTYVGKYLKHRGNGSSATAPCDDCCWFQNDGSDAMEVSISGPGCRPTMAAALWGECTAIIEAARLAGNDTVSAQFEPWRDFSARVVRSHWNPSTQSFGTIPLPGIQASATAEGVGERARESSSLSGTGAAPPTPPSACNLTEQRQVGQPVDVRELLAFVPFYFEGLLGPDATFDPQWDELFEPLGFQAEFGLRTAERRSPCYNYSWEHGDCWNGPSWPYETARLLTGAAQLLRQNRSLGGHLSREQYVAILTQQHTATTATNDTGLPHVFENVHPDLGYWNNREIMYWTNASGRNQGVDYFHSTFCDLVLSGLLGLVPSAGRTLVIDPLASAAALPHFAVDHVRCKGRDVAVVWDATGSVYGRGAGLTVIVDGKVEAYAAGLQRLQVLL